MFKNKKLERVRGGGCPRFLTQVRLPFTKGIFCIWALQWWIPWLKSSVTELRIPKWTKVPTFFNVVLRLDKGWRWGFCLSLDRSHNTTKASCLSNFLNLKTGPWTKSTRKKSDSMKTARKDYEFSMSTLRYAYLRLAYFCKVRKCIASIVDTTSPSLQIRHFV